MRSKHSYRLLPMAIALAAAASGVGNALASSHREAPFITTRPKVDGTDFYMFRSYEPGRDGFVTIIANYLPLQAPYGGPNYFSMDPNALYEIHIDNNADGREDITFQFRFQNDLKGTTLTIGDRNVAIPLIQSGSVSDRNAANLNVNERYTVDVVRGDRRFGSRQRVTNAADGATSFDKPVDNIGTKTIGDYDSYWRRHLYSVNIPGCGTPGRLFVGQRKEPFAVNLGAIFDLVNLPLGTITDPGKINTAPNTLDDANVTSFAIEVPTGCLVTGDPVIGGWTTASLRQVTLLDPTPRRGLQTTERVGGAFTQVSRLGMPLVNELVVGLPDKDRFNGTEPKDDGQFADYVTHPTLPRLLEIAYGLTGIAPTNLPRTDLGATYLTGVKTLNFPKSPQPKPAEMLRLNTNVPVTPEAMQSRRGALGGDPAGFPNGRRPADDVVDISLQVVMGSLCLLNGDSDVLGLGPDCRPASVPLGSVALDLHDAVDQAAIPRLPSFPYLFTPTPGATSTFSGTTPTFSGKTSGSGAQ